jgi:hypothetical protein
VAIIEINGYPLRVSGKLITIAGIDDEEWQDSYIIEDPESLIENIKREKAKIDIFAFSQRLPDKEPKYHYYMEWDNVAAIQITSFDEWWTKKLPQVTRKNVRRSAKKGCSVKVAEFNDDFVKGIINIYNETPVRQGRPFWHYGKDFETVKRENSSYLSTSDIIGAYHNDELIGFIKLVYVGKEAKIMQIISMVRHQDKRPTNAMIAKAVELCEKRHIDYFIYGKYLYGKRTWNPLVEFKERNGFERINLPKYYVPLTHKGKVALRLNLHHGIVGLIPGKLFNYLADLRMKWYEKKYATKDAGKDSGD